LTPQQKEELEVFSDFSEVSPEPIIRDSIEPMIPPAPDILCYIEGKGTVGFELVRLTNEKFNKEQNLIWRLNKIIKEELRKRPDFNATFKGSLIVLLFTSDTEYGGKNIKGILDYLMTLPKDFSGCLLTHAKRSGEGRNFLKIHGKNIGELSINRLQLNSNPCFYLHDMHPVDKSRIIDRVRDKFNKSYLTDSCREFQLLAYFPSWHPCPDPQDWKSEFSGFVHANIDNSPFKEVWVFDDKTKEIHYPTVANPFAAPINESAGLSFPMKPFNTIAVVVFVLVAVVHLMRIIQGWEVIVNGITMPLWVSVVGAIIAGGLAILLWREGRS